MDTVKCVCLANKQRKFVTIQNVAVCIQLFRCYVLPPVKEVEILTDYSRMPFVFPCFIFHPAVDVDLSGNPARRYKSPEPPASHAEFVSPRKPWAFSSIPLLLRLSLLMLSGVSWHGDRRNVNMAHWVSLRLVGFKVLRFLSPSSGVISREGLVFLPSSLFTSSPASLSSSTTWLSTNQQCLTMGCEKILRFFNLECLLTFSLASSNTKGSYPSKTFDDEHGKLVMGSPKELQALMVLLSPWSTVAATKTSRGGTSYTTEEYPLLPWANMMTASDEHDFDHLRSWWKQRNIQKHASNIQNLKIDWEKVIIKENSNLFSCRIGCFVFSPRGLYSGAVFSFTPCSPPVQRMTDRIGTGSFVGGILCEVGDRSVNEMIISTQ